MSKLDRYVGLKEDYSVPETMEALVLSGVGEQRLKLTTIEVPECGANQLLARVDAVMACASDNKLIDQGPDHALMYGWDVSRHPIIIGHEGTVTIIKVGTNLRSKYHVGQRFAIQPAVPTGPHHFRERYRDNAKGIEKIAVGYTLPGLFAEYVLITEEVVETRCLLPISHESIPFFGAALAEPFSCVIAAQERMVHILKDDPATPRRAELGPRKNGITLIIGAGPMGLMNIEVAMSHDPSKVIVSEVLEGRRERATRIFQDKARRTGISLVCTDPDHLEDAIAMETNGRGVDDVIVALGIPKVQEKALDYLATGGVLNLFGGTPFNDRMIQVDTHRIHYDSISIAGSSGSDPSDIAQVLDMLDKGLIDPGNHVVKCGGLDAASSLMGAVRRRKIDGKGVIYPHARSSLLDTDGWNLAKEREFLEEALISF
ncbi:MAG: zinc-binding dehydrogenase [Candidatus Bathyarchaeota archaeon]|nr:zinc-binding dehydrogenase [Candidatus Bathyarchaeota archaeon]